MLTPCKACISQILHFQRILYLMIPIRHLLSRVFTILLRRPKRPFSWGYFSKCYLENADILRFYISITESYMICIYDKHRYQAILSRLLAWQYLIHSPPHLWLTTFNGIKSLFSYPRYANYALSGSSDFLTMYFFHEDVCDVIWIGSFKVITLIK